MARCSNNPTIKRLLVLIQGPVDLEISWQLRPRELSDRDNQRLLNELGRHHERGNLLRFLYEPQTLEPTNNAAERALRPAVIARKVSQ